MTEAPSSISRFPCAQCGADLRFEPGAQTLVCTHCGHAHPMEEAAAAPIEELDFRAALADRIAETEIETTQVVACTNCGAEVAFDADIHAAECPFCASPVVTDTGAHRHFKPRGILPFLLSEREARGHLARWLEGLWFAPSGVRDYARAGRALQGVYLPFWTFDADTRSRYSGQRGDTYYVSEWRTVFVNGKHKRVMQKVPKIRWTRVSGRVARAFDDVLVIATRSLPKRFADRLTAWDLHGLMPYSESYLAGYRAEAYTVDLEEGYQAARAIMDIRIRRDVRFDIGGDRQRIHQVETKTSAETFKHILLPVYLAAYRYRGQSYRFVVNARTGEVIGERPYSRWKIGLATICILALVALFVLFAMTQ